MKRLVYILQSQTSARFYTGKTSDVNKRLVQHNDGFNKSTRNKGPWVIIWKSDFLEDKEASVLESKVKKRGAKRFLEDMNFFGM